MSTLELTKRVPFLVNGQHMTQAEFHRRYLASPPGEKWELIGGIVYTASPLRSQHGDYDHEVSLVLGIYRSATPGLRAAHNATTILGEESEPQPDLSLRVLPEWGGQVRLNEGDYLVGSPELVIEIAYSSLDIDMHQKREDYEAHEVREYLVVSIEDEELFGFDFVGGNPLRVGKDGIFRSRAFPGLWIDRAALFAHDAARLVQVAQLGIAAPEHARFVKRLERARQRRSR